MKKRHKNHFDSSIINNFENIKFHITKRIETFKTPFMSKDILFRLQKVLKVVLTFNKKYEGLAGCQNTNQWTINEERIEMASNKSKMQEALMEMGTWSTVYRDPSKGLDSTVLIRSQY